MALRLCGTSRLLPHGLSAPGRRMERARAWVGW